MNKGKLICTKNAHLLNLLIFKIVDNLQCNVIVIKSMTMKDHFVVKVEMSYNDMNLPSRLLLQKVFLPLQHIGVVFCGDRRNCASSVSLTYVTLTLGSEAEADRTHIEREAYPAGRQLSLPGATGTLF